MDILFLNEHRCKCGKLLLKGVFFDATLEIKCRRCGKINKIGRIQLINDDTHYLMIINDQGEITNISDSACRILGYISDELVGKHFTEIDPAMPKEIIKKFFEPTSTLNEENYFQLDTLHQTKGGKKIPTVILLKLYSSDQQKRYVLISTKLKNCVDESQPLAPNELKFLDNACDFYFDVDKNGIGEYVSPSVEKIFGLSQKAAIGKSCFDLVSPETRTEAKKNFEYFSAKEQPCAISLSGQTTKP